jgi:hypothetical protein
MGPLTLEQLQEKLTAHNSPRKLADLAQLWEAFGLKGAFLESSSTNAFVATVIAENGIGTLKETNGMISLQITPFCELTGAGVRERPENAQLLLVCGEKEFHLAWPGPLNTMLADPTFQWVLREWRASHTQPHA